MNKKLSAFVTDKTYNSYHGLSVLTQQSVNVLVHIALNQYLSTHELTSKALEYIERKNALTDEYVQCATGVEPQTNEPVEV